MTEEIDGIIVRRFREKAVVVFKHAGEMSNNHLTFEMARWLAARLYEVASDVLSIPYTNSSYLPQSVGSISEA